MMNAADTARTALRADAETILRGAIRTVLPDEAVRRALTDVQFPGRVFLVAAGKAAWQMANVACKALPALAGGVVVTKYGHVKGKIDGVACYEGGHPVPDENGLRGTAAALALTGALRADDTVLFLLSGGGSALFEQPLLPLAELAGHHAISSFPRAQILWRSIPCASGSHSRQGRALCRALRARAGLQHRAERYRRRPARHDRLRSRVSRPLHLRAGHRGRGKVPAASVSAGTGSAGGRNAENARKRDDQYHRQRARSSARPPKTSAARSAMSRFCSPTASPARRAKREAFSHPSRARMSGPGAVARLPRRRGDGRAPRRRTGKGGRNQELALSAALGIEGLSQCARRLRRVRRHGWPDRRGWRHRRRRHGVGNAPARR